MHTFPVPLNVLNIQLQSVRVEVIGASGNPNSPNKYDVTSTFNITDVTGLNGSSIQCEEASGARSELLHIAASVLSKFRNYINSV